MPTLVFLVIYYNRTPTAPPLFNTLLSFIVGGISGFVALGLEYMVEFISPWAKYWNQIQHLFLGSALRQLVEIAPIEEGCKFIAVLTLLWYLQLSYKLRATTAFFFAIAVSLGFTAQENWLYLYHGESSILERIISTPVHAIFSAPWGYALGIYVPSEIKLKQNKQLVAWAWLNSVFFHGLVNILARSWSYYPSLLYLLSYSLFPLLLWMFWRLEQFFRKIQEKPPIKLISAKTSQSLYWQRSLILLSLILGGNAIFGLLILSKKLDNLQFRQFLKPDVFWYVISVGCLNIVSAVLAWSIYRYLRSLVRRRDFSKYHIKYN